jgi:hypothetical protein
VLIVAHPQAICTGLAIMQNRPLGIGAMTALSEKSVDLAGRHAIRLQEAQRNAELADP